ncbi:MAG: flavodoxin-dependent (E)-4-hydroxy-3-methylbut-2-enyl-diphosphate synthase [Firmicutes bacterium]|nr:flavodoxin-dependent (E)-4-hydroxy-3-methylbut-2-enyl-diphosphate synthase [Bacillota bacterium]
MNDYSRKKTRLVHIGPVAIGGGEPVSIQSMCNTPTTDVAATLAQLRALAAAGAQIGRLAVPDQAAAECLPDILRDSPLPLVADIHFDYRLALAAIRGGVQGLRLNPGNIGGPERVRQVAEAAGAAGIPIRIGVNGGSLEKSLLAKYGGITPEALVESALNHAALLEQHGFHDIKLSLKASSVPTMVAAYRLAAERTDLPLHLGVTEAGSLLRGSVKTALGLGALLLEGIGDTLRVSLTDDPVREVEMACEILSMLGLRQGGWEFVSCPTCGRTRIDLIALARRVEEALSDITPPRPLKVAVMGCAVNGPGEAADADIGLAAGADGGLIFRRGEKVGYYTEDVLFDTFIGMVKELTAGDPSAILN